MVIASAPCLPDWRRKHAVSVRSVLVIFEHQPSQEPQSIAVDLNLNRVGLARIAEAHGSRPT